MPLQPKADWGYSIASTTASIWSARACGFGILDQLRGHFDHVVSFLMDRATLDAHAAFWGSEDKPLRVDLHRLTPEERALYADLRDNRMRTGLRLEQEHIGFHWLAQRLRLLEG